MMSPQPGTNRRQRMALLSLAGSAVLAVLGLVLVLLGHGDLAIVVVLAMQSVIIAVLWIHITALTRLNDSYVQRTEESSARIIADISRAREDILANLQSRD